MATCRYFGRAVSFGAAGQLTLIAGGYPAQDEVQLHLVVGSSMGASVRVRGRI